MSNPIGAGRFRSPPYPSIPLQRAVERAEQLYRQERDHLAPLSSAARAWGMSPTSSGPIVTVAALRQYGLLDVEGSGSARKVRVSPNAIRIILDKVPSSPNRQEALRRAFLAPKVFAELWDRWKADLPSDQTIINYLILDRRESNQAPFSDQSAPELLANYRASLPFAVPEVEPSVQTPTEENGKGKPVSESRNNDDPQNKGVAIMEGERELTTGLLSRDASFRLIVSGKIGEKELDRLIRKLQLDKEILADNEPI